MKLITTRSLDYVSFWLINSANRQCCWVWKKQTMCTLSTTVRVPWNAIKLKVNWWLAPFGSTVPIGSMYTRCNSWKCNLYTSWGHAKHYRDVIEGARCWKLFVPHALERENKDGAVFSHSDVGVIIAGQTLRWSVSAAPLVELGAIGWPVCASQRPQQWIICACDPRREAQLLNAAV